MKDESILFLSDDPVLQVMTAVLHHYVGDCPTVDELQSWVDPVAKKLHKKYLVSAEEINGAIAIQLYEDGECIFCIFFFDNDVGEPCVCFTEFWEHFLRASRKDETQLCQALYARINELGWDEGICTLRRGYILETVGFPFDVPKYLMGSWDSEQFRKVARFLNYGLILRSFRDLGTSLFNNLYAAWRIEL